MKLLLDENLPKELSLELKDHVVSTVEDEGWRSIKNGELLRLMIVSGFEVLITRDTNLTFQQNLRKYPIVIIVLRAGNLDSKAILRFGPSINKLLKGRLKPGANEIFLNP